MTGENDRDIVVDEDGGPDLDQTADHAAEIDRRMRLGDQIGGRFIEPARRGDEPVEPVERVFENADRPLRALIFLRQGATQWLDGLANDRNWRLERVGIVFRRLPDVRG